MMRFIGKVIGRAAKMIKDTVMDMIRHFESVAILSLSAVGVSAILQQLPFIIQMPLWIESSMVIPVVSVLIILGLLAIYQWRTKHATAQPV